MTKKERIVVAVLSLLFIGFAVSTVVMVVRFLRLKVAKFEVEQKLQQVKDTLELNKVELKSKEKKIGELKEQISKFKDKVEELQKQLDLLRQEKEKLEEDLDEAKIQIGDLQMLIKNKEEEIGKLDKKMKLVVAKLNKAKKEIKGLKEKLKSQRRGSGEISLGKVVISADGNSNEEQSSNKALLGRVLSVNTKYNFAIIAVPRGIEPQVGQQIKIVLSSGRSFVAFVDTARKNMMSIDLPENIGLSIGDAVGVYFLENASKTVTSVPEMKDNKQKGD